MRKILKGKKLATMLLALAMLLCSFPAVFAEDTEITAEEAGWTEEVFAAEPWIEEIPEEEPWIEEIPEEEPEEEAWIEEIPEEEPEEEPWIEEIPEEEPEEEPWIEEIPEEIPEDEPEEEPWIEEIPEEEPEEEAWIEEIPEEEPEEEPWIEEIPEDEPEEEAWIEEIPEEEPEEEAWTEEIPEEDEQTTEAAEESEDRDFVEMDDDYAGSVSEELLEEFDNPETYEAEEFSGSVEIEMKNSEIHYGGEVTLAAKVSGTEMNHRIVWEANDGDGRGWFTVGSGLEYTFTVTRENVNREYRVSLFAAD